MGDPHPSSHDGNEAGEDASWTNKEVKLVVAACGNSHRKPDATWNGRPTRVEIDLDALFDNVQALRAHIGARVQLAVAVKANAYGHGAIPVATTALAAGATHLLVACIEEGVQLRKAGIDAPILVMGYVDPREMARGVDFSLTMTIANRMQALAVAEAAATRGVRTFVHLKVDTGMNRYGTDSDTIADLARIVGRLPSLFLEGLFTHFARADEASKESALQQFHMFLNVRDHLRSEGFDIPICHVANSAATIDMPETHLDMVRCGIAIYGMYGSAEVSRAVMLRPVLSLKSRVGRVHELKPGDGVSYGHTFVADKPTKAALVPIGYGDGYHRCLSNRADVLIHGQRARILGRICMDQLVVDVTTVKGVEVGDEVVLIGQQGNERITAAELADLAGTIEYEITTPLSPRVPRLYFSRHQLTAFSDLNSGVPITAATIGSRDDVRVGGLCNARRAPGSARQARLRRGG